jgi:hypothetical protein
MTSPVILAPAMWGEVTHQKFPAGQDSCVSGATVILNFLKKSMPRMEPTTVVCKKLELKSLP